MTCRRLSIRLRFDEDASESLSRGGFNSVLGKLSPGIATFVMNLLIGRIGGSAVLGTTQTVISTASFASLAYPTPVSGALSRNLAVLNAKGQRQEAIALTRYVLNRVLFVSLLASALFGAIAAWQVGAATSTIMLTALMIFSVSLRAYTEALHVGIGKTGRLAKAAFAIACLSTVFILILLLLGLRSAWVLLPLILANIVFTLTSWPPPAKASVPKTLRRQITVFVLISLFGTMASTGFQQAGVLLAALHVGEEYTGNLAAAFSLTAPLLILAAALSTVLFPALAVAHETRDKDLLRQRVDLATRMISLTVMGVSIPLIVLAPQIVSFIWGDEFADAVWMMQVLSIGTAATAIAAPSVSFITSESNRGMIVSAVVSVGGALAGVAAWFAMIGSDARTAIPLGLMIAATVTAGGSYAIAWLRLRTGWLIHTTVLTAFLAGAYGLASILAAQGTHPLATLLYAIGLTALWGAVRWRDLRTTLRQLAVAFRR